MSDYLAAGEAKHLGGVFTGWIDMDGNEKGFEHDKSELYSDP